MGAAFGLAQGIMPLFGWALGVGAAVWIAALDHWIALGLLGFLGIRMIREALASDEDAGPSDLSGKALFVAAVATSIDAAVAGVTLPTLGAPIAWACVTIGVVTAILSFVGAWFGAALGSRFGKWAEIGGGLALIGLGVKIFVEHRFMGG